MNSISARQAYFRHDFQKGQKIGKEFSIFNVHSISFMNYLVLRGEEIDEIVDSYILCNKIDYKCW